MKELPSYDEKPTAYLDQNIHDLFVKFGMLPFAEELKSNYRIIYSDETLNEIKRSNQPDSFIKVLSDLNAFHISLKLNPDFSYTNDAILKTACPSDIFKNYCDNYKSSQIINDLLKSLMETQFKLSGGLSDVSFDDISKKQKRLFRNMIEDLDNNVQLLPIYLRSDFNTEEMIEQFNAAQDDAFHKLKESVGSDKNYSAIKKFREATGVGPIQLNNIEPPNVLEKIFEKYKKLPSYSSNITIEQFYCIDKNLINSDKDLYSHQKVTAIYSMLNTLGYYPDSKVHKIRRFVAASSDQSHASMASFCSKVFSGDVNFLKKARAAYEFLAIPTVDVTVEINNKSV